MPHASKSLVDLGHDLRWLATPSKLEQFLPDMASISMDDSVRNPSEELSDHVSLVTLGNRVESFLNNMTAKGVHAQRDDVTMYGVCDGNDLIGRAMLEASLNEEVTKTVDHERVGLIDDSLDDVKLLFSCANLQLLLQKDGSLLIIVAHNLVDNILPVTRD